MNSPTADTLNQPRNAIAFLTHIWSDRVEASLRKLRDEKPPNFDIFVLADVTKGNLTEDDMPPGVGYFGFTHDVLYRYKKSGPYLPNLFPGNMDAAHLSLFDARPQYGYYWLIENDVAFSGHWRTLFDAFADNDADLLATSVCRRPTVADWNLWHTLEMPRPIPPEEQIRAFLPFYRISRHAVEVLIDEYQKGWSGHFEATLSTALMARGCRIEDFGGDGEFVAEANRNRFYTSTPGNNNLSPGSFVFRPSMVRPGDRKDRLWHPVKGPDMENWEKPPPLMSIAGLRTMYWVIRRWFVVAKSRLTPKTSLKTPNTNQY